MLYDLAIYKTKLFIILGVYLYTYNLMYTHKKQQNS